MFGYIKLDSLAPVSIQETFKKNYCVLCKSLEFNYGQKTRLLLSFDVTFLLTLFLKDDCLEDVKRIPCFGKTMLLKEKMKNPIVKKAAALNIAMAEAELLDHIQDDRSKAAKTALCLFKKPISKVQKEYPNMHEILINGYAEFQKYESDNRSLEEIETMFAKMILSIAKDEFDMSDEYSLSELSYISKWLYFIDAVDDLDKDIKNDSFNCLKKYGSKRNLLNLHHKEIKDHLVSIKGNLKHKFPKGKNESVVDRIIFFGMPESILKVLDGVKL